MSFALLVLLDLGRAAFGGGARSRKAVHCARIVSNVSTSSWDCFPEPMPGNSILVNAPLSWPISHRGMR